MRRAISVALVLGIAAGAGNVAAASRGVQFSPDGRFTFVIKDINQERFAIIREPDGTVTGNVFFQDCRTPKFIICDPLPAPNEYSCAVSDACREDGCTFGDFQVPVTLPADFFTPPDDEADDAEPPALPPEPCRFAPRAVQFSPDESRRFINKDLDEQRFAITRFENDLTLTGNVFFPDGSPPKFIVCEYQAGTVQRRFSCQVADGCPPAPATCDFDDFSSEVIIHESFFEFDARDFQTLDAFRNSDTLTRLLRLGAAAIPQGSPSSDEVTTQRGAQETTCPSGGTVTFENGNLVYNECRSGNLVCTGTGAAGTGQLSPVLECTDIDRERTIALDASLTLSSTLAGPAFDGTVLTSLGQQPAVDFLYDKVTVGTSAFEGPLDGTLGLLNAKSLFKGPFGTFDYEFNPDDPRFVKIVTCLPSCEGPVGTFIFILVFDLDLETGVLTAR